MSHSVNFHLKYIKQRILLITRLIKPTVFETHGVWIKHTLVYYGMAIKRISHYPNTNLLMQKTEHLAVTLTVLNSFDNRKFVSQLL